jgi:modulator of FtsH protease HflK
MSPMDYDPNKNKWGDDDFNFKLPDLKLPHFKLPNIKFSPTTALIVLILVIAGWILLSGFYKVNQGEQGIVRRFGKHVRTMQSGLHFKLPYPIEKVDTPSVTSVHRLEVGFRTIEPGPPAKYKDVPEESQMLTGDENIVNASITIQYKIADPVKYLFNVKDIEQTIMDVTESALRQVIGKNTIDDALTVGKFAIQEETLKLCQSILDVYDSGILIIAAQLQDVAPPTDVDHAFKDVASAREDKNKYINEAQGYQNDVIPKARGEAEKMVLEAEAYKQERINQAKGDTESFLLVLKEYSLAKEITRKRLYIEALESFLPNIKKYILNSKDNGNLLTLLPLEKTDIVKSSKGGEGK